MGGDAKPTFLFLSPSSIDVTDRSGRQVPLEVYMLLCPGCGRPIGGYIDKGPDDELWHVECLGRRLKGEG